MKNIISGVVLCFLVGCASSPLMLDVDGLERSGSVSLSDMRPSYESERETFSLLITSDAYAIYRNSDSATIPSPLRLLQHRAYEKFSGGNSEIDIKVYHLVSYTNMQSTLRAGAFGSILGPIGAGVAVAAKNQDSDFSVSEINPEDFESISSEKEYTKAYFSEGENPNKAAVFVVYIDAEINGKRRFVRSVSPIKNDDGRQPYIFALEKTIESFLGLYET